MVHTEAQRHRALITNPRLLPTNSVQYEQIEEKKTDTKQQLRASVPLCDKFKKKLSIMLLFLFLPTSSLFARSGVEAFFGPGRTGDDLTLRVALIGPGDELYFWWGHIGLLVEDRVSGHALFFDWGHFSFDAENFFLNFAFGRLIYSCMVSLAEPNFNYYIRTNRDIILYTLDLPAESIERVMLFAEYNMRPENRDYLYHHFRDNCATRIRDIIDIAVDGQFKAAFGEMPSRFTLRQHVRRHTWFNPFFDWILNFWMGQDIDRPITVWDDMFLPSEVTLRISDFRFIDRYGQERQLVSDREVFFQSQGRPIVLDEPRLQWPRTLLASMLFSGILLGLNFAGRKLKNNEFRKGVKIFFGLLQSFLGLFFGIAGSMLFFMATFTEHDYTFNNLNLLFVNPLFLILVPLGLNLAFSKNEKKRSKAKRFSKFFWAYVFIGGVLTMVLKIFPAFFQQNQVDLALILPITLTMFYISAQKPVKDLTMSRIKKLEQRKKGKA